MRLDQSEFPIIWLTEDDSSEDIQESRDALIALLERGERFVLAAARMPGLHELSNMSPEEKKMRAQLFKDYKSQLTRLCAGMIMVGSASRLPPAMQKAIAGMSGLMGVSILFATDIDDARATARERLGKAA